MSASIIASLRCIEESRKRQAAAQGEPPDVDDPDPPPEMREGGSRTTRSRLTKSVSTATTTGPYTEGSNRA